LCTEDAAKLQFVRIAVLLFVNKTVCCVAASRRVLLNAKLPGR
jgi:hypothetical protein